MIPILIIIFTYIPYILMAYFGYQILTRVTSQYIPYNKKEDFSHQMEYGPFNEEQSKYNIPQPSEPAVMTNPEPVVNTIPEPAVNTTPEASEPIVNKIKPLAITNNNLNNQYNNSRIDLNAKLVDPSVNELEMKKNARKSNEGIFSEENAMNSKVSWNSINECGVEGCKSQADQADTRDANPFAGITDSLEETTRAPFFQ